MVHTIAIKNPFGQITGRFSNTSSRQCAIEKVSAIVSSFHYNVYIVSPQYGSTRHSYQPMTFKKPDGDPYQQSFLLFSSSLTEHCRKDMVSEVIDDKLFIVCRRLICPTDTQDDTEVFIECAKSYKLHGLPIHVLCDHNYKVASLMTKYCKILSVISTVILLCRSPVNWSGKILHGRG